MLLVLGIACLGTSGICFISAAADNRNPNPVIIVIGFATGWMATLIALMT